MVKGLDNPPYSGQLGWLRRARQECSADKVRTLICLLPVRTDNEILHETLHRDAECCRISPRFGVTVRPLGRTD